MSLAGAAARGAAITLAGQALRFATQMIGLVILARLLTPADFGLVAIIVVLVGLGELIRDFGLGSAAIQAPDLTLIQRSNLFWISAGIGIAIAGILCLFAPLISNVYGEVKLSMIAIVLSSTIVFNALASQFRASLARNLRFTSLAAIETLPPLVSLGLAIALAATGAGYWAIVSQNVALSLVSLALAVVLARWVPKLPARTSGMRPLVSYGLNLVGAQVVAYGGRNVDTLVLGLSAAPSQVGLYTKSYELVMNPLNQINAPLSKVAVPVLARLQQDTFRFNSYLLRAQRVMLTLTATALTLGAIVASPLIELVLGGQWAAAAPIFQLLAMAGIFRAIAYPTYWIALSRGYTRVSLYVNLISLPIAVASVWIGALVAGPVGVAAGVAATSASTWLISLGLYGRLAGAPSRELFKSAAGIMLSLVPAVFVAVGAKALAEGAGVEGWLDVGLVTGCYVATLTLSWIVIPAWRRNISAVLEVASMIRRR